MPTRAAGNRLRNLIVVIPFLLANPPRDKDASSGRNPTVPCTARLHERRPDNEGSARRMIVRDSMGVIELLLSIACQRGGGECRGASEKSPDPPHPRHDRPRG